MWLKMIALHAPHSSHKQMNNLVLTHYVNKFSKSFERKAIAQD